MYISDVDLAKAKAAASRLCQFEDTVLQIKPEKKRKVRKNKTVGGKPKLGRPSKEYLASGDGHFQTILKKRMVSMKPRKFPSQISPRLWIHYSTLGGNWIVTLPKKPSEKAKYIGCCKDLRKALAMQDEALLLQGHTLKELAEGLPDNTKRKHLARKALSGDLSI